MHQIIMNALSTLGRKKTLPALIFSMALLAVFMAPHSAFAATKTWNGLGADNNWQTAANWVGGSAPVAGDSLVFDSVGVFNRPSPNNNFTAGTSFASITVAERGYTISGNSVALTTGVIATNYIAGSSTISLIVGGTGATVVMQANGGTLVLTGVNTYTGGTTIKAGTLSGTVAAAFGTNSVTIGDTSGSANATLNGGGAVTHSNAIVVASGNTGLASLTSSANATFSGGVTGSRGLTLGTTGSATLTLSSTTVNPSGTITNASTGTGTITISAVIGTNVTGVIQNSLSSQMNLSATNTYTSPTTIKAGTLAGGSPAFGGNGTIIIGDSIGSANATFLDNSGNGGQNYTNAITVASGNTGIATIFQNGGTTLSYSGPITMNHDLVISNGSGSPTFTGGITGTGNLTISGTGGITFSTATINMAGTITNNNTSSSIVISGGIGSNVTGVIQDTTTAILTISGAIAVNSATTTLTALRSGASAGQGIVVSGGTTGTGNLVLNNNTGIDGALYLYTASLNHTGTITNSGTGIGYTYIYSVIGTNVTGLTQNSITSKLYLNGANTFTGFTALKAGTIYVDSATGFGNGGTITLGDSSGSADTTVWEYYTGSTALTNPIVAASGNTGTELWYATVNNSYAVSGGITLNHDLTITLLGNNTFSGAITGTGNLTVNNNSGGTNPITGGITVTGDVTLNNNSNGALNVTTNPMAVTGNVILYVPSNGAMTISQPISGTGDLTATVLSNGGITMSGGITKTGNLTLANQSNGSITISTVGISNISTITNTGATGSTISVGVAMPSGGLTLTNTAAGTLTLSGGVTGTGNLSINNNSTGVISLTTTSVNNSGTITHTGSGTGGTTISAVIGTNVTSLTHDSATSVLTLSDVGTFTGGGTIKKGRVIVSSANGFGNGGTITLGDSSGSSDTFLEVNANVANPVSVASGNSGVATITSHNNGTKSSGTITLNHDLAIAGGFVTFGDINISAPISGTGNLALSTFSGADGKVNLTGGVTITGNITISNNTNNGNGTINLTTTSVNNTGTIINQGPGTTGVTISAIIGTNVTSVTQNSSTSQLNLSGANTFTGGTFIKTGILSGSVAAAFGNGGTITLGDSSGTANATLNGGGGVTHTNPITVASGNSGIAKITSSASATFSGPITLNHDLLVAPAANALTLSGGMTGTANVTLATTGAGTITLSTTAVNNVGTVTNSGSGSGATTISGGIGSNVTSYTQNSSTSQTTLSGSPTISAPFTISTGTVLSSSGTVSFANNFTNNGTFTHNSGTVAFNGSSGAQAISGSSNTTFNSLTVNNSSGLTLSTSATANGTLTFTSGKITTDANTLTLGSSATVSGAGTGKYVYGNLKRLIPNSSSPSAAFDIGDSSNYTPVTIAFTGTTAGSGSLTAFTTAGDHSDIASSAINPSKSVNRYWTITNSGITGFSSYSATFTFVAGDIDGGANTSVFVVARKNSTWSTETQGTRTSLTTQATGITAFGDYQIGEVTALVGAPGTPTFSLITKTSLSASWTAASDAISYKVERCLGSGCSSFSQIATGVTALTYADSGLTLGSTYRYRILATNTNGDGSYSGIGDVNTLSNQTSTQGQINSFGGKLRINGGQVIIQ